MQSFTLFSVRVILVALALLSGTLKAECSVATEAPSGTLTAAPPNFSPLGFATVPGYGMNSVNGGGEAPITIVRTTTEFRRAVERLDISDKKLRDNSPRVVLVAADVDLGELANEKPGKEIKAVGIVRVRSNTTIFSKGEGMTIRHGVIGVQGSHNVIIRNLKFRDLWEPDPTGEYDSLGWDYVRITNSGKTNSHHVWVDHCDFGKVYDGMIDITHGSDLVTISWCRFAGDERGPQKKCCLIGHSSSASAAAADRGYLNVTFHHNVFKNIADRAPRTRFGNIHVFNDLVDGAENATISVTGAVTLIENCTYKDTRIATSFSHDKDSVARGLGGTICIVNSRNVEPRPSQASGDAAKQFEIQNNCTSNVSRAQLQFNAPSGFAWKELRTLPYNYVTDPVEQVPALLSQYAGTGKVPDLALTTIQPSSTIPTER